MTLSTARLAQEQARERAVDKQEKLCQLSRALAVLASASVITSCWDFKFLITLYPSNLC